MASRLATTIRFSLIALVVLVTLFPIYWMTITAFRPMHEVLTFPPTYAPSRLTIDNFLAAFEAANLGRGTLNSLGVAFVTSIITLILAALAAYGFARYSFPWRDATLFTIVFVRIVPGVVVIFPLFLLLRALGLTSSYLGLILIYAGGNLPFAILFLEGFIRDIPQSIEEASEMAGASKLTTIRRVVLPLITPGLVAVSIFVFIAAWDEFFLALILLSGDNVTLPVMLMQMQGLFGINWHLMAATAFIMMLPPLLFGFYVTRYLIHGLARTGV